MDQFIQTLQSVQPTYVYIIVFLWLAAESIGFLLPNELMLLYSGSLIVQGHVQILPLIISAILGSFVGASCSYTIGRYGGRALVIRFGKYIRLDGEKLDAIDDWFQKRGVWAIGFSRLIPFVRMVASYPAGIAHMKYFKFAPAVLIGSTIWCTLFVFLGKQLGANWQIALNLLKEYTLPSLLILGILLAGYIYLHKKLKGFLKPKTAPES